MIDIPVKIILEFLTLAVLMVFFLQYGSEVSEVTCRTSFKSIIEEMELEACSMKESKEEELELPFCVEHVVFKEGKRCIKFKDKDEKCEDPRCLGCEDGKCKTFYGGFWHDPAVVVSRENQEKYQLTIDPKSKDYLIKVKGLECCDKCSCEGDLINFCKEFLEECK